jgi:hypothetical protein
MKAKSFSQKEMTMLVIPKLAAADEESLRSLRKRFLLITEGSAASIFYEDYIASVTPRNDMQLLVYQ